MSARARTAFHHADGTTSYAGGFRLSPIDPRDTFFAPDGATPSPREIDLRADLTPIENQEQLDSCTANALAGAYEYLQRRATRQERRVSRLFIYYTARVLERDPTDDGITIRDGVHAMRAHGACAESTWPYREAAVLEEPPARAFEEAKAHTLHEAHRVHIRLDAMRACLAAGYPFVFGLKLFASFSAGGDHGRVPMPGVDGERRDPPAGGHTMLGVGYRDEERIFIVRNSWGKHWGEGGYCFLPYDYVTSPRFTDECWMLRSLRAAGA